jgi:presenilin-like A22 family membrane protease
MAIVGAFFAAAFAISGILRGDVAPALVGGLLGGVVVYLVLQRVTAHHADLRRRRESEVERRR